MVRWRPTRCFGKFTRLGPLQRARVSRIFAGAISQGCVGVMTATGKSSETVCQFRAERTNRTAGVSSHAHSGGVDNREMKSLMLSQLSHFEA